MGKKEQALTTIIIITCKVEKIISQAIAIRKDHAELKGAKKY